MGLRPHKKELKQDEINDTISRLKIHSKKQIPNEIGTINNKTGDFKYK